MKDQCALNDFVWSQWKLVFKLAYKPNSITDPQTTALILDKMFYQLSFQVISLIVQTIIICIIIW